MREQDRPEEIAASNERSLSTLSRAINLSNGHFALILVRCNYEVCSSQMWQRLQELTGAPLSQLVLQQSIKTLFGSILATIIDEQTSALVVFGLESVTALDQVLISTNRVRDEFRKSLTFPLVLWITDEVLQKLARFAPDIKSWAATSIKFELATEQLLALWQQTADELFAAILDSDVGEFLPNNILNLAPSCRRRQELEAALRDLHARDVSLEPALVATWEFILGRDAFSNDQIDVALQQYQQSLNFWQQALRSRNRGLGTRKEEETGEGASISFLPSSLCLERVGILLHHIGLCYCRQAELQPAESFTKWEQARESFTAAIEVFATAAHLDLVAQLTIQLGEVLQHLKSWADLQALALQSLEQPQIQNSPVRLAQAYGFLAVVAHTQSDWQLTKDLALTAIGTLEQSQSPQPQHRGLYLLVLAKAQRQMGEVSAAVTTLEQAINLETLQPNSLQQKPLLYIEILEELRSLYFEQQQYLEAFELKQERRSIEQHFGFCTFVGAAPLQPLGQGRGSQNSTHDLRHSQASLEIVAAGRLLDVNCLIERLSRNDHRLTVIHGSSGVGKSSLINAGLVPALEARIIGAREAVPIVQTVYRDWVGELERLLTEALASREVGRLQVESSNQQSSLPIRFSSGIQLSTSQKLQTLLEQLRLASERNLLTVLIFDQFEEFFFICTNLAQRRQFYDFLASALNLPFLKVILSLREDYLHYLLECERYSNLNAITNNILDRQLRYHLGDLSPVAAKNVICTLSVGSQFQLEESLIEILVQDLAGNSEAVRLIELQVVGAQLQAEKITTTAQYYALGSDPKGSLVERSLLDAVSDCGQENEDIVWQILFSLTDDRGTRPLKTQAELEVGNEEKSTQSSTPLILKILVGSGLVFRVPEEPQERYQLVHDYLVEPIRRKYEQRTQLNIVAQLERSETELIRVRKQRLRAIAAGGVMAVLAFTAAGLGWRTEVQRRLASELSLNAQLSAMSASSEALFASDKKFDALLEGLRAARRIKEVETKDSPSLQVEPDTRLEVVTALSQAVYGASERNRFEGHSDVVWSVSFSPDGQLIASASRDKTVKLWRTNGTLVTTLIGHEDGVTSVSFSSDGQLIASGSWDGTVRLWRRDGTLRQILRGNVGLIYSVSFSPNGELIASAGGDGTIRLWTVGGKLIKTFRGHKGIVQSVSFSPNGQLIASAGEDKTIRLWTPDGKLQQTLKGHGSKVNSVAFSSDGQLLASASDDETVRLWSPTGKLLKTFPKQDKWVFGVAFSPDGQLIASTSADNTVKLWDRNGTLVKTFTGHSDSVTAVSFGSTGRAGEPESGTKAAREQESAFTPRVGLTPLPDHSAALSSPQLLIASASLDKTIKLWQPRDQPRLILPHQDDVRDVTFSPEGELIATASNGWSVKIWTRTGKLLKTLKGHSDRVYCVSFSPDGQLLASASRDGTVRLWKRDGTLIKTLRGHSDWVLNVAFSPDGERLASASRDGTVKLWNRNGVLLKTLTGHRNRVNAVSFSPDGQLLASVSDDNTTKLWTADGTLLKTLSGHSNWVLDVSFSPDSQTLASASYDNTVKLWSRDGELLRTLKGHTDSVAHVRFSPTGKILATTSWDNRVQLWRIDDQLIKTLEAHKDRVTAVSWSKDGKALASASQDKTVIVWNLDLDELFDKSCNRLRDYLQNNSKVRQSDRTLCEPMD
jgi:WD40 repeat protein